MPTAELDRAAESDRSELGDLPDHFMVKGAPVEIHVYSLDQVDAFCSHFWDAASRVGFDYETNTLNTTWEGIQLGGLGLATRDVACYLWWQCFESRSYDMPQQVKTKVRKLLFALNKKRLLTVFNLKYELAVTANPRVFGVYLDGLQDCLQYCRTLDVRGGLKEILVNRMKLGDKWTDEIDFWLTHQRTVLSQLVPTASGKPRAEVAALKEGGIAAVLQLYDDKQTAFAESNAKAEQENEEIRRYNEQLAPDDEPKKLKVIKEGNGLTARDEKILASIRALLSLQPDFQYDLEQALADYWIEKAERGDFEALYTELPLQYCAKYCALDSYNTVLLMDNVSEELERRGLLKAADYYNQQMYLGAAMEEHAFVWDDAQAEEIKERYQGTMRDALKRFLLTPRARGVLDLTPKDVIDIQSTLDLTQLKKFFNPDSTNPKETELLSKILVSPKTRLCMLFHEVNSQYLIDAELTKKTMPALSAVMNKLLLSKGPARAEALAKTHDQLQLLLTNKKMRPAEVGLCVKFANYSMDSANAELIQELGTAIRTYQGCDIDDNTTWTEEFQAVFYYKLYKKVSKIISSFLDGAGGRKNCMVARRADDGKVIRMTPYTQAADDTRRSNLILYEPNYNVNGAKTKRWTAAYHGVPPMSETRRCYVSRFANGLVVHKDYSQQELRVLAALSGDKNMLQAFIDNKDLHRMVASQIFGIPEADVTGNQRATAKCLRGDTNVVTNLGLMPIKKLYEHKPFGIRVLTKNEATLEHEWKPVLDFMADRYESVLAQITVRDRDGNEFTFSSSEDHHCFRADGQWVEASQLRVGDYLYGADVLQESISFARVLFREHYPEVGGDIKTTDELAGQWDHVVDAVLGEAGRDVQTIAQLADVKNLRYVRPARSREGFPEDPNLLVPAISVGVQSMEPQEALALGDGVSIDTLGTPAALFALSSDTASSTPVSVESGQRQKARAALAQLALDDNHGLAPFVPGANFASLLFRTGLALGHEAQTGAGIPMRIEFRERLDHQTLDARHLASGEDSVDAVHKYEVVRVEKIQLEAQERLYDLEVMDNHNFLIAQPNHPYDNGSANFGVFVHNSANFGLVYLKTEETFAQDYLNGDVDEARKIFSGIFATFPRMKEWMNERLKLLRKAIQETKKRGDWQCIVPIETLWGDPIEHMFSINKKMDVIDAERYFINWVIQSTASNIGALSIARVEEWIKLERMQSVINGFTHDALDGDVEGSEFLKFMESVPKIAEKRPLEEFKLPVRLDAEIGVDLGSLVEIKRNKETDAFVTDGRMDSKIEGRAGDVQRLIERLRLSYPDLQYEKLDESKKYNGWSDLFSLKGCYYPDMGREVITESGRLIVETA
jgi:hypothetical protein